MKKFYKIVLIIAGCMFCIGIMFGIVGIVFGGGNQLVDMVQNGEFQHGPNVYLISWDYDPDGNCFDSFNNDDFNYDDFDNESFMEEDDDEDYDEDYDEDDDEAISHDVNNDIDQTDASDFGDWNTIDGKVNYPSSNIQNLSVGIGGGALKIIPYDEKDFTIEAQNDRKYQCTVYENTLYIKSKEDATNRKEIKLYIPKEMKFDRVSIKAGAGQIQAKGIDCKQLAVKVGAGQLITEDMKADQLKMRIGAGEARLKNVDFGESSYDVGMGSINLDGKLKKNTKINCALGSVNVKLDNKIKDFNYEVQCAAGSVVVDGKSVAGLGATKEIDNGSSSSFRINCNMGNVTVHD